MSMIMVPDRSKIDSVKKKTGGAAKPPKDPAAKAASEKVASEKTAGESKTKKAAIVEVPASAISEVSAINGSTSQP